MTKYDGRVQVWIRQDDRDKWDAIEKKSEWLHEQLNWEITRDPVTVDGVTYNTPMIRQVEPTYTDPEEAA